MDGKDGPGQEDGSPPDFTTLTPARHVGPGSSRPADGSFLFCEVGSWWDRLGKVHISSMTP